MKAILNIPPHLLDAIGRSQEKIFTEMEVKKREIRQELKKEKEARGWFGKLLAKTGCISSYEKFCYESLDCYKQEQREFNDFILRAAIKNIFTIEVNEENLKFLPDANIIKELKEKQVKEAANG